MQSIKAYWALCALLCACVGTANSSPEEQPEGAGETPAPGYTEPDTQNWMLAVSRPRIVPGTTDNCNGFVVGKVIEDDAHSGQKFGDKMEVRLHVDGDMFDTRPVAEFVASGHFKHKAQVEEDGRFRIGPMPPGKYKLQVSYKTDEYRTADLPPRPTFVIEADKRTRLKVIVPNRATLIAEKKADSWDPWIKDPDESVTDMAIVGTEDVRTDEQVCNGYVLATFTDLDTNLPMSGAWMAIKSSVMGPPPDPDDNGLIKLGPLPPGKHAIKLEYSGATFEVENLVIEHGKNTRLDLASRTVIATEGVSPK